MKLEFRNNKDFWAGMMLTGIGAGAIFMARNYPVGTSMRMGPGYFPMVLSGILILFGLYIMFRGLRKHEKIKGKWSIRALIIIPLSIVVYAILMDRMGFIPAVTALVFVSAVSSQELKFKEVFLLVFFLVILSISLFIWVLRLPYPLIGKF